MRDPLEVPGGTFTVSRVAVERRHLDLRPEDRLGDADRHSSKMSLPSRLKYGCGAIRTRR